jgi:phosphopantetheine--protein transferase-like protein
VSAELNILTGIDIVKNSRIKRMLERNPDAVKDIFSPLEIEYCEKKRFYEQSYGARFAVKEAIIKALDLGILSAELPKIEMVNSGSGKPIINIHSDKIKQKIYSMLGKDRYTIKVSVAHEKEYSVASVIIY